MGRIAFLIWGFTPHPTKGNLSSIFPSGRRLRRRLNLGGAHALGTLYAKKTGKSVFFYVINIYFSQKR